MGGAGTGEMGWEGCYLFCFYKPSFGCLNFLSYDIIFVIVSVNDYLLTTSSAVTQ